MANVKKPRLSDESTASSSSDSRSSDSSTTNTTRSTDPDAAPAPASSPPPPPAFDTLSLLERALRAGTPAGSFALSLSSYARLVALADAHPTYRISSARRGAILAGYFMTRSCKHEEVISGSRNIVQHIFTRAGMDERPGCGLHDAGSSDLDIPGHPEHPEPDTLWVRLLDASATAESEQQVGILEVLSTELESQARAKETAYADHPTLHFILRIDILSATSIRFTQLYRSEGEFVEVEPVVLEPGRGLRINHRLFGFYPADMLCEGFEPLKEDDERLVVPPTLLQQLFDGLARGWAKDVLRLAQKRKAARSSTPEGPAEGSEDADETGGSSRKRRRPAKEGSQEEEDRPSKRTGSSRAEAAKAATRNVDAPKEAAAADEAAANEAAEEVKEDAEEGTDGEAKKR
ncbi:hypothetical protein JCM10207_008026 [Rhodosporidiobolus poonsookiae]